MYGSEDHAVHLEALQELAVRISGERSVDAVLPIHRPRVSAAAQRRPRTRLGHGTWGRVRLVPHAGGLSRSHGLPASLGERGNLAHGRAVVTASMAPSGESHSATRRMEFCPSPVRAIATDRTGQLFHGVRVQPVGRPRVDSAGNHRELSRATHSSFVGETLGVCSACSAGHSSTSRSSAGCGCLRTRPRRRSRMRARSQNSTRLRQQLESHNA